MSEQHERTVPHDSVIKLTVDGTEDHNRATREICLAVADVVDDAIGDGGHPVEITIETEVENV